MKWFPLVWFVNGEDEDMTPPPAPLKNCERIDLVSIELAQLRAQNRALHQDFERLQQRTAEVIEDFQERVERGTMAAIKAWIEDSKEQRRYLQENNREMMSRWKADRETLSAEITRLTSKQSSTRFWKWSWKHADNKITQPN